VLKPFLGNISSERRLLKLILVQSYPQRLVGGDCDFQKLICGCIATLLQAPRHPLFRQCPPDASNAHFLRYAMPLSRNLTDREALLRIMLRRVHTNVTALDLSQVLEQEAAFEVGVRMQDRVQFACWPERLIFYLDGTR
jgi:hypothetical protein